MQIVLLKDLLPYHNKQKRKVKEIMKLDKGTRLAKEELREKKKMRSSVLEDLLEE